MDTFTFEIRDSTKPLDGSDGDAVLAGFEVGGAPGRRDLGVGDDFLVPLRDGRTVSALVVQFPLTSFVEREWRAIAVTGVSPGDVAVGRRAVRAERH